MGATFYVLAYDRSPKLTATYAAAVKAAISAKAVSPVWCQGCPTGPKVKPARVALVAETSEGRLALRFERRVQSLRRVRLGDVKLPSDLIAVATPVSHLDDLEVECWKCGAAAVVRRADLRQPWSGGPPARVRSHGAVG